VLGELLREGIDETPVTLTGRHWEKNWAELVLGLVLGRLGLTGVVLDALGDALGTHSGRTRGRTRSKTREALESLVANLSGRQREGDFLMLECWWRTGFEVALCHCVFHHPSEHLPKYL
jgi:hypothetical protein